MHTVLDMYSDEDNIEDDHRDEAGRRRGSISTVHSFQLYTPDEERNVVRKFDRKLVVFVALLYMLSFLDRSSRFFIAFHYYHNTSSMSKSRFDNPLSFHNFPSLLVNERSSSMLILLSTRYRECENSWTRTRFTFGFK